MESDRDTRELAEKVVITPKIMEGTETMLKN